MNLTPLPAESKLLDLRKEENLNLVLLGTIAVLKGEDWVVDSGGPKVKETIEMVNRVFFHPYTESEDTKDTEHLVKYLKKDKSGDRYTWKKVPRSKEWMAIATAIQDMDANDMRFNFIKTSLALRQEKIDEMRSEGYWQEI